MFEIPSDAQLDYEFEWDDETGELLTPVAEVEEAPLLGPVPEELVEMFRDAPVDPVQSLYNEIEDLKRELAEVKTTARLQRM